MHHAKTDSEVTSIAPSSPPRSPSSRRPAYYVQSPSRDSHDGEKATTASFHSTPVLSPSGSPPHSHSSVGRHSRESSTSRFSGSLKPHSSSATTNSSSRKVSPNDHPDSSAARGRKPRRHGGGGATAGGDKPWKKGFGVIEEEGLLDDDEDYRRALIPRRCYFPLFILAFFALFFFFALILWGASRSQKPHIVMKSITFEHFNIQAGTDASGVPTDMASLNATVRMTYRNKGSFFGVHVSSSAVDLTYSMLSLGSGYMKEFYQGRKSQRSLSVSVIGDKIPLYGTGASMSVSPAAPAGKGAKSSGPPPVPLTLGFTVRSRAYVLGKLVKPKFYNSVQCSVVMDQTKFGKPVILDAKSCQYD